ncbi:phenylacetate-CoA oxygenase subunit PaaI [Mycobacterium sp. SM1]|uniref:Phenylacetic acid catabolic protein n=1 Tax=Mycobacterium sp. SM1 TaxID=2816243 RepID=UPI001BCB50D1|nr:Phenylacetic acid catabolic protein [Mycobacterium sp. SM1]MBS4730337.1 phenylacetate-CoA oxygenase subunit PaaI [Mycobacterium sp. SM1]
MQNRLLSVADTKWVLGHWLIKVVPNARRLDDFTALMALAQEELGHTRALFAHVEEIAGLPAQTLELDRQRLDVRSVAVLDAPPTGWMDFLVRAFCADLAALSLLATFSDAEVPPNLVAKIAEEEHYHRLYFGGCLEALDATDKSAAAAHASVTVGQMVRWLESVSGEHDKNVAGRFVGTVADEISAAGIPWRGIDAGDAASVDWDAQRGRPTGTSVPAALYEFMVPTNDMALLARRPRATAVVDGFSTAEESG